MLLNSFLPLLAANHPSIRVQEDDQISASTRSTRRHEADDLDVKFEDANSNIKRTPSPLALSTKISAKGVGLGYIGAVAMQLVSILLLLDLNKFAASTAVSTRLRTILFCVGLVWMLGTIPCALWLRDRPGPPLNVTPKAHTSSIRRVATYITFAWTSVFATIRIAIQLPQLSLFLVAWFLLSDAIATVSGTAILFARTELKMDTVSIAVLSITATSSGIAGAFCWPPVARYFNLRPHNTIVACVFLMLIIPIYGLIGYLPFVKSWGVGGLQQAWEIYPLGLVHGFVMGGLSSYCRSFYGQLIPPGSEAAFYALYSITDKGSSAVGPAVVGVIVDYVGSIRPAFAFLAVLIALPIPLLLVLDAEKGGADAKRMALRLGGRGGGSEHAEGMYTLGRDDDHNDGDGEDGDANGDVDSSARQVLLPHEQAG